LLVTAGGKWPVMNTAFLTRPVATKADLQDRILLAKRYYAPKKALWLFILFNEWLDYSTEAEQIFSMNGLCHVQDCIGMQAKGLLEPRNSAPELTFRLVKRRR
ncbi:MAG: hypothetical protein ACJ74Z_13595, partial [Bryobacteraceae bacterium]